MAYGKLYTGTIMSLLIAAGISFAVLFAIPSSGVSDTQNTLAKVLSATIGTGSMIFLLNVLGLWFGKKSFGATGTIISLAVLGFGFYWLYSGQHLLGGPSETINTIIFAVSMGIGGLGILGSLGVVSAV